MNIRIQGGQKLNGVIKPSGSKNSAVSIIPSTLMFDTPVTLMNVPEITDVNKLIAIMQKLGSKIDWQKKEGVMKIDNRKISFEKVTRDDWNAMRGISLLWGPMLARFGKVDFGKKVGKTCYDACLFWVFGEAF